jgi:hypothetical protein
MDKQEWRCYVCGSTIISKYNAVQDDGRFMCDNEHLLHQDALARIADLEAEVKRITSVLNRSLEFLASDKILKELRAAETELTALKMRGCKMCSHSEQCCQYVGNRDIFIAVTSCSEWAAREGDSSKDKPVPPPNRRYNMYNKFTGYTCSCGEQFDTKAAYEEHWCKETE